ncbi:hypothetical protein, partial [Burkholderia cenocepacia]|uniref:hypothetical protein n=1 Tax=Burkholderia cenocepacia TaxID=95486 RepID=UPI001C8B0501
MLAHAGRYDHRGDRLSGALLFKHGAPAMGRGRAPIKKRPGPELHPKSWTRSNLWGVFHDEVRRTFS